MMRLRQKIVSLAVAGSMLISSAAFAFSDTEGHWAGVYIDDLYARKIVIGYGDTFKPEGLITREETAQMLSSYIGGNSTSAEVPPDCLGRWSTAAVQNLLSRGIINGYEDGTFRPENRITRAEFATMVYNMLSNKGKLSSSTRSFSDTTVHWSKKAVDSLAGNAIIKGYPDGKFNPEGNITRAEAATIISLADNPRSGIATNAHYAKQPNSTKVEISAHISYATFISGARAAAPADKISVYMQSASSGHRLDLSVSKTADPTVFSLGFDEKSLNPGETYRVVAQVEGESEQLWTSSIDQNTVLGKLYASGDRLFYKRDQTQTSQLTVKNLLQTSLKPVGNTLYVWGGGWNAEDTGSGPDAVTIGVSPQWKSFFDKYGSSYNYQNTKYQIRDGLDCSGFIGWTVYNTLNTMNSKDGYVMLADKMARDFSSRGWGSYSNRSQIRSYKPGDILSSASHVYMVVGVASDGSLVIVHSTPSGVQINGTPTPSGNSDSKAVQLAAKYMSAHYPDWYKKFPNVKASSSFLKDYDQMTWDVSGNALLSDPEGLTSMSAEQVLYVLFGK